jgi:hypothetical protein
MLLINCRLDFAHVTGEHITVLLTFEGDGYMMRGVVNNFIIHDGPALDYPALKGSPGSLLFIDNMGTLLAALVADYRRKNPPIQRTDTQGS